MKSFSVSQTVCKTSMRHFVVVKVIGIYNAEQSEWL